MSKLARQSDDGQADSWLPPSHWPERSSKVVCSMFFQLSRDGKEGLCIARCFHQLKRRPMADGIDATEYEVTVELHATERGWDEYLRPDVAQQSALKLGERLREAAERRARHEQRSLLYYVFPLGGGISTGVSCTKPGQMLTPPAYALGSPSARAFRPSAMARKPRSRAPRTNQRTRYARGPSKTSSVS